MADTSDLPSIKDIAKLRPELAAAAQKVYDEWEQDEEGIDEEFGSGGICQDVASAMADVLIFKGIDCITLEQTMIDQHVYCAAKAKEGVVEIDIPPSVYETGFGYVWKKRPDIRFGPENVYVGIMFDDPAKFEEISEEMQ